MVKINIVFNKKENNLISSKSDTDKLIYVRNNNLITKTPIHSIKKNNITALSQSDNVVKIVDKEDNIIENNIIEENTQNSTVCYGLVPGIETVLNTNVIVKIPMKTVYIDDFENGLKAAKDSIEKEIILTISNIDIKTTMKRKLHDELVLKDDELNENAAWTATESVFDKSGYIINNVANCSVLAPTELISQLVLLYYIPLNTIHINDLEKGLLTGNTYQFNEDGMPYIDFDNMPIMNVIDDKTIINKPLDEGELTEYADITNMSIVYINDVEKDAYNKKVLSIKENKFSYSTLPFIHNRNTPYLSNSIEDWQHTINFLKFKINTQN